MIPAHTLMAVTYAKEKAKEINGRKILHKS
jgi:hypothetical protein